MNHKLVQPTIDYLLDIFGCQKIYRNYADCEYGDSIEFIDDQLDYAAMICFLENYGYTTISSKLGVGEYKCSYNESNWDNKSYKYCTKYFEMFDKYEEYMYEYLTPLAILNHSLNDSDFHAAYNLLKIKYPFEDFKKLVRSEYKKELDEIINNASNMFNTNKSNDLISYFDYVGQIYLYLIKNNDKINITNKDDLKVYSYLTALLLYDDVNTDFNAKKIIIKHFDSVGLNIEKVKEVLGLHFSKLDLVNNKAPLVLATEFYTSATNIEDVLYEVKEKYSLNISKVFNSLNVDDDEFTKVINEIKETRKETMFLSQSETNNFYNNLNINIIDYLYLTVRIYKSLVNQEYDRIFVQNKEDLISLSLLIASYYNNEYLSTYFNEIGITLDYIEKLLNIKLSKEDIEKINVDKKELCLYFKQYNLDKKDNIKSIIRFSHLMSNKIYNKIYEYKTGVSIYDYGNKFNLEDIISEHFGKIQEEKDNKLKNEIFDGLDIDIYYLLSYATYYYNKLSGKVQTEEERKIYSLLYAFLNGDKTSCYLKNKGIDFYAINNFINCDLEWSNTPKIDINIVDKHFRDYIFEGNNKGKNREEVSLYAILENVFRSKNINFKMFLKNKGISLDDFIDVKDKVETCFRDTQEQKYKNKSIVYFKGELKLDDVNFNGIVLMSKVYNCLSENTSFSEEEKKELSIIISYLLSDYKSKVFLERNGLTLDRISEYIGIDIDKINTYSESYKVIYEIFCDSINVQSNNSVYLYNIMCNLINKSKLVKKLCGDKYEDLLYEFTNKKEKEVVLTKDEILSELSGIKTPALDINNFSELVNYGDELSNHIALINDEYRSLVSNTIYDKALSDIKTLVPSVYVINKPTVKKRIFAKLNSKKKEDNEVKVDLEVLSSLKEMIKESIDKLNYELICFDYIRRYNEIYIERLNEHIKETKTKIEEEKALINNINGDDPNSMSIKMRHITILEILNSKLNSFELSMSTRISDLCQIHNTIVNHYITINALKTALTDLIPLMGSKMLISIGQNTENEALMLSESVIDLFNSVINKNVEETKINLERLKKTNLPIGTIEKLADDVEGYINDIIKLDKEKQLTK